MDRKPLLEIQDLSAYYTDPEKLALRGVSLRMGQQETVALVGPNGAGKSTVLKSFFREVRVKSGTIRFRDQMVLEIPPTRLAGLGIGYVPEGRRLFGSMTVEENLDMGAYSMKDQGKASINKNRIFDLFPVLFQNRKKLAKKLSGGEQQMVAFGRAMMFNPKLLLMDEPSLGLAPRMVSKIFEMIQAINRMGVAVLLVEQNVRMALEISHWVYVLKMGKVASEGPSQDFLGGDRLKDAYLGG